MARVGFKKAKYNKIDPATSKYKALTGSTVPMFEKVVDESFEAEYNNAELFANDALCESDYSFKKGTLSVTVADDKDEFLAELFGNTVSQSEVTSSNEDIAPEFGYGHIIPKLVEGAKKYKVEFFPRIKFNKATGDNASRGESVEFKTTSLEATVYPVDKPINGIPAGVWEKHETFDTLSEAETYLDGLLTPGA